ncbi:hypothetical protein [Herbaspirillum sp. ST 5-3]|uniref:DUF6979 family protein n=1 Tax=Oxalobacteraceae TaxID=75682 RepID=UPI0010A37DB9|nr:hypothetical protein [Herbaspirillum sp. ST 5-3]
MDTAYPQTKFGITALRAADLASRGVAPADAWRSAALSIFPDSLANQVKGCPKSAFLGLAEAGHIDGILPGKYTTSVDNKRYAVDALRLLQANPALADKPDELWQRVLKGDHKRHNNQMNVVIALWKARKFVCQNNSK